MQKETQDKKTYKTLKKITLAIFYILAAIVLIALGIQKISNNATNVAGYRIFRIASESMVPKYEIGDVILVKETPYEQINQGDDVVYIANTSNIKGIPIAHSLIKKEQDSNGNYFFYTQGIANASQDPVVRQEQVLGIVKTKLWILSLLCNFISKWYGMVIAIFIPLLVIIVIEIRDLMANIKQAREEK